MDKFLKVVKFGLDNRAAILSVWILIAGIIGGTGYIATQEPVEQITRPLPIPEQPESKLPVKASTIVTRSNCKQICDDLITEHEKKYHFR